MAGGSERIDSPIPTESECRLIMPRDERTASNRSRPVDKVLPRHELRVMAMPDSSLSDVRDEACRADGGREDDFLQLFRINERRIHAFIFALVPIWSDADDLLQEVSTVMWRKRQDFRPGSDFVAWALSIARFEVLNYRKKQRRNPVIFSDETVELLADRMASLDLGSDSRRDALDRCITKLSGRDRVLIDLRYECGATTQSVADRVGRSIHAVYKSLNRVHGQLLLCIRKTLAAEGIR
jgi:RNA polymerase sigma-70 factor, ECF subfamily